MAKTSFNVLWLLWTSFCFMTSSLVSSKSFSKSSSVFFFFLGFPFSSASNWFRSISPITSISSSGISLYDVLFINWWISFIALNLNSSSFDCKISFIAGITISGCFVAELKTIFNSLSL
ncbi:unnamed protein product [Blepharisma stoltei]|uniref:Secreted protein n=1 Tax=Blepharisma stoltei TaxID=1481888 RepID=A0AAU9J760_9CILI|nr:unnamed protein product [Blepharisma stoltei]